MGTRSLMHPMSDKTNSLLSVLFLTVTRSSSSVHRAKYPQIVVPIRKVWNYSARKYSTTKDEVTRQTGWVGVAIRPHRLLFRSFLSRISVGRVVILTEGFREFSEFL